MDIFLISAILACIVAIISIYKFVIPLFQKKTKLKYDVVDCYHWHEEEYNRSGLVIKIDILNTGKAPTTIKNIKIIRIKGEKLYDVETRMHPKTFKIMPLNEERISYTWFFSNAILNEEKLDITMNIEHTYDTNIVQTTSKILKRS